MPPKHRDAGKMRLGQGQQAKKTGRNRQKEEEADRERQAVENQTGQTEIRAKEKKGASHKYTESEHG